MVSPMMDLVKLRLILCCNLKPGSIMKKTLFTLGLAIAATLTLTNCAKQEAIIKDAEPAKQGVPFELVAGIDTKTTAESLSSIKWAANDAIAVFHTAAGSTSYGTNDKFTIAEEDLASNTFKGTVTDAFDEVSNDWYVFYPYNSYLKPSGDGYIDVGGNMTQDFAHPMAHLAGSKFPLYGKAEGVANGTAPSITMNQAMSIVKVHVTNDSGAPVDVKSVTFATEDYDITGQFYINFSGATPLFSPKSGKTGKSVTLTVTNTTPIANGASADYYIAVPPFDAVIGKNLTLTVNNLSKGITLPAAVSFVPGKIKTLNFSYDAVPPIYSTAFDYPLVKDGGSTYYNKSDEYEGVDEGGETSWYITYGNWANGNSAQFRVYNGTGGGFGELVQKFDCSHVTEVTYEAVANNTGTSLTLTPYYSTDKGANWTAISGDAKVITTTSTKYKFTVSATGAHERVRVKLVVSGKRPDSSNTQITIDNLSIYGSGTVLNDPTISADNVTDIPAIGASGLALSYTPNNFSGADDVEAVGDGTVVVASAVSDHAGTVTYSVNPNYGTSARNGSITLSSASQGANKVVSVAQLGETFSVSGTTITILKDETTASFTITTPTFGWTAVASPADEKNLTISSAASGSGNASAQTITVSSTAVAGAEEQTLGTIVIYRNGNEDDPQKKVVTIKKASNAVANTYTKVTSITSGAKYLLVNISDAKVATGVVSSSTLQSSSVTINGTITGSDTIDGYVMTITALTGDDAGYYTLAFGSKYLKYVSGTNLALSDTATSNNEKWAIAIDGNGFATITNKASSNRFIGWNNNSGWKAYSTSNLGSYPLPSLFKLDE